MKDLYVHGIVKDYDESINSINKYLFSENERLNAIIDDLEEKIDKAIEKLKEIKTDLDFEPWSIYQVRGEILFDLLKILGDKENEMV